VRAQGTRAASTPGRRRPAASAAEESLRGFQERIEAIYGRRDRERGLAATFMWFAEEVGELSRALRGRDRRALSAEFADTLAWLVTLASMAGVDMALAARKYAAGCPRCQATPCRCTRRRTKTT
jgi:NTP pyrophosphatase (non-canonical NTP hydrolase)